MNTKIKIGLPIIFWWLLLSSICTQNIFTFNTSSICDDSIYFPKQTLVDIDNDGDLDCFIGSWQYGISFFENKGSKFQPQFALQMAKYNNISLGAAAPHFADINNDGLLDLFIGYGQGGCTGGTIVYYQNIGTKQKPAWKYIQDNFAGVDACDNSVPFLYDWDKDGDLDLIVGGGYGELFYCKNIGNKVDPQWGKVDSNFFREESGKINVGFKAAPVVKDINKDGKPDLIIGNSGGELRYYQNISVNNVQNPFFKLVTRNFAGIEFYPYLVPSIADLNGDNISDILIFNETGKNKYYKGLDSTSSPSYEQKSPLTFNIDFLAPVISCLAPEVCDGEHALLTSDITSGNIQWQLNGSDIIGAINPTINAANIGSYTVKVNQGGCEKISNAIMIKINTIPPKPNITSNGATTFCTGGNVILNSNSTTGIQWFKNDTTISNATELKLTVTSSGNYSIKSTINNCTSYPSNIIGIKVNEKPITPTIKISGDTIFCDGGNAILNSSSTTGIQWFKNNVAIINATDSKLTVGTSGNYNAKSTIEGCTSNASNLINITVNPIPEKSIISKSNNELLSSPAMGYQWFKDSVLIPEATKQNYRPLSSGQYSVIITINGCQSIMSDKVNIIITAENNAPGSNILAAIYPNPVTNKIIIESDKIYFYSIQLYDMNGKLVKQKVKSMNSVEINVDDLIKGCYVVMVNDINSNKSFRKLIVKL